MIVPGAPGESAEVIAPGESGSMANPGAYGDDEVTFVTNMVPHHTQALAMAELAPGRAQDERVSGLAERITLSQGPEIATMQAWLTAQGLPRRTPRPGTTPTRTCEGWRRRSRCSSWSPPAARSSTGSSWS